MSEQRIKTILMDCDGVLVDSEMIYLTSLVHYLKLFGIDTTIDDLAYLVGSDIESITEKSEKTIWSGAIFCSRIDRRTAQAV